MRILLDESLPRRLARNLPGHDVRTVQECGWSGLKNGDLLRVAKDSFDVLVTGDQNLEYQQNTSTLPIAIVVLGARDNRVESLLPLVPEILKALTTLAPRTTVKVGAARR